MCFTPLTEIKHNSISLRLTFYTYTQVIRGTFWLQLWTVKKFSQPRVSLNDGSKEVENGESLIYFAARTKSCRLRYVCRAWLMCRDLFGTATRSIAMAYSADIVSK